MASFDPSIISQIPDMAGNPMEARAKAYKLADLITNEQRSKLLLGQEKRETEEQQKRKDILQKYPGDIATTEGQFGLAKEYQQAGLPKESMEALRFGSETQVRDLQKKEQEIKILDMYQNQVGPAALRVKETLQTQGLPAAQAMYSQLLPTMPQELRGKWPQQLPNDPQQAAQLLDGAISVSEKASKIVQQHLAERKEALAERKQDTSESEAAKRDVREDRRLSNMEKNQGSDQDLDANARAIANYQEAPPALSSRNPRGYKVMAKVLEFNPDYDANQYKTKGSAERGFATGKQGDTVRSLNVAVQHLNLLDGLSKDLKNTDVRTVNKFYNALGKEFGKPAVTNFDTAKAIVGDEVVKSVISSGAGALADREGLKENFDRANSPEQLAGVIKTAKGLMAGQLKGLRQQYESSTGKKDFENRLAPETKSALEDSGAGVKPYSDPEKERRYQEYKKAHPNG